MSTTFKVPGSIPPGVKVGNLCDGEGDSLHLCWFPPGTQVSSYNAKLALRALHVDAISNE